MGTVRTTQYGKETISLKTEFLAVQGALTVNPYQTLWAEPPCTFSYSEKKKHSFLSYLDTSATGTSTACFGNLIFSPLAEHHHACTNMILSYLLVQKKAQVGNRPVTSAPQSKQHFPSCLPVNKQSVVPPKHLVIITLLSTGLLLFLLCKEIILKDGCYF